MERRSDSFAVETASAPFVLAAVWLITVGAIAAVVILLFADMDMVRRHMNVPGGRLELVAIALTAIASIVTAFRLSHRRHAAYWVFVPVAPATLWMMTCAHDCLDRISVDGPDAWDLGDSPHCVLFILAVSIPLGLSLVLMLHRLRRQLPGRAATLAGLGVASIALGLLQFFHHFDMNLMDLTAHMVAVAIVAGGVAFSTRLLPAV